MPEVHEGDDGEREKQDGREAGQDLHDGLRVRGRLGPIPILTPIGTHMSVATATTTTTRTKVRKPRPKQCPNWPKPDVWSKYTTPRSTPQAATPTTRAAEDDVA